MDFIKLEQFKNKEEKAKSAIASQEVREHLADFLFKRIESSNQLPSLISSEPGQHASAVAKPSLDPQAPKNSRRLVASGRTSINCSSPVSQPQDQQSNVPFSSIDNSGIRDHPLRKTASMPTMHIPCKAQSLSRRKQMERRTTLSPLMSRRSRRSRPALPPHNNQSNLIDCSTNQSRSQSRSSSSPPIRSTSNNNKSNAQYNTNSLTNPAINLTPSNLPFHSQEQKQLIQATANDVDKLQNNLQSALYFSGIQLSSGEDDRNNNNFAHMISGSKSTTALQKAKSNPLIDARLDSAPEKLMDFEISIGEGTDVRSYLPTPGFVLDSIKNDKQEHIGGEEADFVFNNEALRVDKDRLVIGKQQNICWPSDKQKREAQALLLRKQQHQKVTEALLKKVARRSTNKVGGSSLDMDTISNKHAVNQASEGELRQWSLDNAEISSPNARKNAWAISRPSSGSKDSTKARLATINDTAKPQSPFSSITLGCHIQPEQGNRVTNLQQALQQQSTSTSSSLSSFSQQDSLEDCLAQAMDLTNSNETQKSRSKPIIKPATISKQQIDRSISQTRLQESFDQMRLAHNKQQLGRTEVEHLLRSMDESLTAQQHPPKLSINKNASFSFDNDNQYRQHASFLARLSDQYNLSTSAQHLFASQSSHNNIVAAANMNAQLSQISNFIHQQQQQRDQNCTPFHLNNPLLAANSAASFPFACPHTSATATTKPIIGALPIELSALSDSYRSALISAQLAHQRQVQTQQYQSFVPTSVVPAQRSENGTEPATLAFFADNQLEQAVDLKTRANDLELAYMQRSLIARTLSSPQLPSAERQPQFTHSQFGKQHTMSEELMLNSCIVRVDSNEELKDMFVDEREEELRNNKNNFDTDSSLDLSIQSSSKLTQPSRDDSLSLRSADYDNKFAMGLVKFNPSSQTGVTYDLDLCSHQCNCKVDDNHPENKRRVLAIWNRLYEKGLLARCSKLDSRVANLDELKLCHESTYCEYFGRLASERVIMDEFDLNKLALRGLSILDCKGLGLDIDTAYSDENTPKSARLAAGLAIEAAIAIAFGRLKNAFAIIRPPGHHAEYTFAMGFCFFNNVAIAAKVLTHRFNVSRVLIVDLDVHHGNGIQKMFYDDKTVLYISIHRFDDGRFFPGTGYPQETGFGEGEGYNWNIAWFADVMGDCEYMAAFRSLVMPVSREYNPEIVLVACGFDAARGHSANFGGYQVSPACFGWMTRQLMSLASGKLVLCLEGGYHLEAIADCSEQCLRALLGDKHVQQVDEYERSRRPTKSAVRVLREISLLAGRYWPSTKRYYNSIDLPENVAERK